MHNVLRFISDSHTRAAQGTERETMRQRERDTRVAQQRGREGERERVIRVWHKTHPFVSSLSISTGPQSCPLHLCRKISAARLAQHTPVSLLSLSLSLSLSFSLYTHIHTDTDRHTRLAQNPSAVRVISLSPSPSLSLSLLIYIFIAHTYFCGATPNC